MSIPSAANRVFPLVNATFRISGATYSTVSNIEFSWGYRINEEYVVGTNDPLLVTGGFHGEITVTAYGASDHRWENAIATSSGIVTTLPIVWIEGDTQATASTRTWTASGKFTEYTKLGERDGIVQYRLRGILVTAPTVA